MKYFLPFLVFVFALQSSPTRSINRAVFLMRDFNSHTLTLICFCFRQRIVKRIHFLFFPIMQLSERAINSLENVLHTHQAGASTDEGAFVPVRPESSAFRANNHPAITELPRLMVVKSPLGSCLHCGTAQHAEVTSRSRVKH